MLPAATNYYGIKKGFFWSAYERWDTSLDYLFSKAASPNKIYRLLDNTLAIKIHSLLIKLKKIHSIQNNIIFLHL